MSGTYTYPGVYVEELPSSVRSIIGVGTSITAFVGRALKGPVDKATLIHNFSDYQRIFGGLWKKSNMSYAVYQYFQNGGVDAIIVRVIQKVTDDAGRKAAKAARFELTYTCRKGAVIDGIKDTISIFASDPGSWGENLEIIVSPTDGQKKDEDGDFTYFDLEVYQKATGVATRGPIVEQFRNVSLDPEKPRFISKLLTDGVSTCLRVNHADINMEKLGELKDQLTTALSSAKEALNEAEGDLVTAKSNLKDAKESNTGVDVAEDAVKAAEDAVKAANKLVKSGGWHLDCCIVSGLASDGTELDGSAVLGDEAAKTGMYALKDADLFNLLCIPAYETLDESRSGIYGMALKFCNDKRALLIVDPPASETKSWDTSKEALEMVSEYVDRDKNGAIFFPRIVAPDPLEEYRLKEFDPCGAVAGVIARTDAQRGIWKAPAGIEATLMGVPDLSVRLTNEENGELNPKGINCLRILPDVGRVIWGSRTLRGADSLADQWKYLPVRRTALYIEETLFRGTQWVVFEPNDERLWSQIRLNVGAFMHSLFVKGAFQGTDPKQAYLVKCDSETTTQTDIDAGIVNILVGFAPLKPAEFVILKIQQLAGQESE